MKGFRKEKQRWIILAMILAVIFSFAYRAEQNKVERMEIAKTFFVENGLSNKPELEWFFGGIDFAQPVQIVILQSGEEVLQFQIPGCKPGNFFTKDKSATPNDVGIYYKGVNCQNGKIEDRIKTEFEITAPCKALVTTAKGVVDTWSIPGKQFTSLGGAKQMVVFCDKCLTKK